MLKALTSGAEVVRVEQALSAFYRTERSSYGLEEIDHDGLPEYVAIVQQFAPRGASVLEFGAGTWRSPLMLHRAGFRVVGCDLFSEADLATMAAVKAVFNPTGRCNPGKVFPTRKSCAPGEIAYQPHPLEASGLIQRL